MLQVPSFWAARASRACVVSLVLMAFTSYLSCLIPPSWPEDLERALKSRYPHVPLPFFRPSAEQLRDLLPAKLDEVEAKTAKGPAKLVEFMESLYEKAPRRVLPLYLALLKALQLRPSNVRSDLWEWKYAFALVSAIDELYDLDQIFVRTSFWEDFLAAEDQGPGKRARSASPQGHRKKSEAAQGAAGVVQVDDEKPGDMGDQLEEIYRAFPADFDQWMAVASGRGEPATVPAGASTAGPSGAGEPSGGTAPPPQTDSARQAGLASVREASAGSALFNMNDSLRWENWFSLNPDRLPEWERGMEKMYLDVPAARLPQNTGAAAEQRSLIQGTRLLLNREVSWEKRAHAYAFHTYVRLTGNLMRMTARAMSDPAKRQAAVHAGEQWVKKALGSIHKHPMQLEIENEVHREAGNLALAAGIAALRGGFAPGRGFGQPSGRGGLQAPPLRGGFFGGRGRGFQQAMIPPPLPPAPRPASRGGRR